MRKSTGFTLIELTMVLLLIGVLVTLAISNYARSIERSRCAFALNMIKTIRNAALVHFRENQTFSGMTLSGLETLARANFYSDDSHPDWQFTIPSTAANDFTLHAIRRSGPHAGTFIELTAKEQFGGSTYPYKHPGEF